MNRNDSAPPPCRQQADEKSGHKQNEVLPAFAQMLKERMKLVPTHLLVLLPALERRDNILVESRGDGL